MKIKLAMLESDSSYLRRVVPMFNSKYAEELEIYSFTDDRDTWFDKIRILGEELGYAPKPKDYKQNPDAFRGHVGDISAVLRLAITGRRNSPDLYDCMQVLGEERVKARLNQDLF